MKAVIKLKNYTSPFDQAVTYDTVYEVKSISWERNHVIVNRKDDTIIAYHSDLVLELKTEDRDRVDDFNPYSNMDIY